MKVKISAPREAHVVGDDDEGHVTRAREFKEEVCDLPRASPVEVTRRLICDDQRGVMSESARERHALLFSP
jgi:hypothetical protein